MRRRAAYDPIQIGLMTHAISARDMLWIAKDRSDRFNDAVTEVFDSVFMNGVDLKGDSVDTPEGQKTYETVRREYEKNMLKYADYRTYLKFVLEDHPVSDEDSIGGSVASSVPKDSGGEKENAKYIILLIGLHMLYKRDDGLNVSPGIVFLDEAFRKLDRKRCGAIINKNDRNKTTLFIRIKIKNVLMQN